MGQLIATVEGAVSASLASLAKHLDMPLEPALLPSASETLPSASDGSAAAVDGADGVAMSQEYRRHLDALALTSSGFDVRSPGWPTARYCAWRAIPA